MLSKLTVRLEGNTKQGQVFMLCNIVNSTVISSIIICSSFKKLFLYTWTVLLHFISFKGVQFKNCDRALIVTVQLLTSAA